MPRSDSRLRVCCRPQIQNELPQSQRQQTSIMCDIVHNVICRSSFFSKRLNLYNPFHQLCQLQQGKYRRRGAAEGGSDFGDLHAIGDPVLGDAPLKFLGPGLFLLSFLSSPTVWHLCVGLIDLANRKEKPDPHAIILLPTRLRLAGAGQKACCNGL